MMWSAAARRKSLISRRLTENPRKLKHQKTQKKTKILANVEYIQQIKLSFQLMFAN